MHHNQTVKILILSLDVPQSSWPQISKQHYHQIPVTNEGIRKTTVIMSFGLFEYLTKPFGPKMLGKRISVFLDSLFRSMYMSMCPLMSWHYSKQTIGEVPTAADKSCISQSLREQWWCGTKPGEVSGDRTICTIIKGFLGIVNFYIDSWFPMQQKFNANCR